MTAQIFNWHDYYEAAPVDDDIDLATAVDAASRDLREILAHWGSDLARQRAEECELMLRRALLEIAPGS